MLTSSIRDSATMNALATIAELSTWANMRLASSGSPVDNVLKDIMEGETMKLLLQRLTGSAPKRLGSLAGMNLSQKINRVNWFIDDLKQKGKLPHNLKVDPQYFARHSEDHVYPVLKHLIGMDAALLWQIAPVFQHRGSLHPQASIATPLKDGPMNLAHERSFKLFYFIETGKPLTLLNNKGEKEASEMSTKKILIRLVNLQLKTVPEGKRLHVSELGDMVDSKVLCALVNSFVPGTFTTEVLLNDRWTINLALKTACELFRVQSSTLSSELNTGGEMGCSAFLVYLFLSGYQFSQAMAVVARMEELQNQQKQLQKLSVPGKDIVYEIGPQTLQEKSVKKNMEDIDAELAWLKDTYKVDVCKQWVESSHVVQAKVRERIAKQMRQRFDTVPVEKGGLTINDLCESYVINLGLTGGNGFYSVHNKETLWVGRKIVVWDQESEEFLDDFTGAECPKGTVRNLLGLHPMGVVDVLTSNYQGYELFVESSSRNRMLKAGSKLLYQVFPGTAGQCQRLLRQAARAGDLQTVKKLVLFFEMDKQFVNSPDQATGNTPLHLAARHDHFDIVLHLLENGADVDTQNGLGCTPLFLATEGMHRHISQLLLEWGGRVDIHSKNSKTALDVVRNDAFKVFLERNHDWYSDLRLRIRRKEAGFLQKVLHNHLSGANVLASLSSRFADGCSLLHWAAMISSKSAVETLLGCGVSVCIRSSTGQTPLHMTREPEIARVLIVGGAAVNAADDDGNTPLHAAAFDARSSPEFIKMLIAARANLLAENLKGWLPVHCAVAISHLPVLEALLAEMSPMEDHCAEGGGTNLLALALERDHLHCAQWLAEKGAQLNNAESKRLSLRVLQSSPVSCKQPVEMLQFLLTHGLELNTIFSQGKSLLHLAVSLVNLHEITNLLLNCGADVHCLDVCHQTPLFSACQNNNLHAAAQLIRRGVDIRLQDTYGKSAFDYITDYEEWIDSGFFTEDTRARLKAYSLKQARLLVRAVVQKVHGSIK